MIPHPSLRIRLAASLLLPIAALACSWAATHHLARQGQEWLIPIRGYDPRDLLRGHFIQYRYDWPVASPTQGGSGAAALPNPSSASRLCIEGAAPHIANVRVLPLVRQWPDAEGAEGCAVIVRAASGARREVRGLDTGILFTSQTRALTLARQLADPGQQGFVRVRIRPDGLMRPLDVEFKPRSSH